MTAEVNGTETSRGRWSDAQFSFGDMLARASADARLRPGDLIGSGTVGSGCLLEVRDATLGRYLEPGDEVVLRVERLGALRTPDRRAARLNPANDEDRTFGAAIDSSGVVASRSDAMREDRRVQQALVDLARRGR